MRFVIHDLVRDQRDSARARREVHLDDATVQRIVDPAPSADEVIPAAEDLARLRRLGGKLRARAADDKRAVQVLDDAATGGDPPGAAHVARRLRCHVREVYEAIRRLKRFRAVVLAEDRREQEAKMRNLREAARAKEEIP